MENDEERIDPGLPHNQQHTLFRAPPHPRGRQKEICADCSEILSGAARQESGSFSRKTGETKLDMEKGPPML
jgi:hypothetical protein